MNPQAKETRVVIVGAGPAGVRAAQALVQAGLRPVVIDEGNAAGGQIYRQPPEARRRPARALYGFEWKKAQAVHQAWQALQGSVQAHTRTLAWNCYRGVLDLHHPEQGYGRQPYDRLILATGAMDRVIPLPGWDQAGVYTLGAAQISLKAQACLLGTRPVFLGTGPLLYLVAYQYAKAGARVAAVLDAAPRQAKLAALPDMAARPAMAAKGAYYLAWLAAHRVPVIHGARPLAIEDDGASKVVHWRDGGGGARRATRGDVACLGYGLRAETQLADLAGCEFDYSPRERQWLVRRDAAGRTSRPEVYVAGDGAEPLGADAAELAGEAAARAVLQDIGVGGQQPRLDAIEAATARMRRFRRGLETAFAWPAELAAQCADDTLVCRCERVTAGEIRQAVREFGLREVNQVKSWTRCGMGRCQSRVCGLAAAEVVAAAAGEPSAEGVGRLRAQPPVKPVPFDAEAWSRMAASNGEGAARQAGGTAGGEGR